MMDLLRCLLLPITKHHLIVPYAAVAEVIAFTEPKPLKNSPKWLIGEFDWRETKLPLICIENMTTDERSIQSTNLHIAILNRISENSAFDFFGIVLQSIPRMMRVRSPDIQVVNKSSQAFLMMEVKVRENKAYIPNLEWIQKETNKSFKF